MTSISDDPQRERMGSNNNDKKVDEKNTIENSRAELREIKLNMTALCVIWVFTFTSFSGLQNLETSLNPGVGNYALAAITGGGTIMCLLAPAILDSIGCKKCLILSWLGLIIFVGSNYWPKDGIIISAAFIEGLASGTMWTAQGVYLTTEAVRYVSITGSSLESVLNTMWGAFGMAFQSTQIWGNLISSLTLNSFGSNTSTPQHSYKCGAHMCPDSDKNNATEAGAAEVTTREYILISIYMAFAVIGLILTIFCLKPLKTPPSKAKPLSTTEMLLTTVKFLFTNSNMFMLLPMSFYLGVEQTIMFAIFTKYYVNCELGIGWIGFTMLCFGFSDTIFSPLSGILGKHLKRPILFFSAAMINVSVLASMILWTPKASEKYVFFLLPMAWGISDAIWMTQSAALVSSGFHEKQGAAFANLRMYQALGSAIAYAYDIHLCVNVKLYICASLLFMTVCFTTIVEYRIKRKKEKAYNELIE